MHPTVKNQSTSPHIPTDSDVYPITTSDQSTAVKVDVCFQQNKKKKTF